jgi:hypothetical protein
MLLSTDLKFDARYCTLSITTIQTTRFKSKRPPAFQNQRGGKVSKRQASQLYLLSSNWKTEYLYATVSKKSIIGLELYFKYNQSLTKKNGSARAGSQFLTFVRRWNNMGPCVPQRGRPSICKQTPVKRKHNWTLRLGHLQKP